MGQPQTGRWAHAFRNDNGQVVYSESMDGSVNLTSCILPDGSVFGSGSLQLSGPVNNSPYSGAPWAFTVGGVTFNGTNDSIFSWGYNVGANQSPIVASLPLMGYQTEVDYNDGIGNHWLEHHFDYSFDGVTYYRPFAIGTKFNDHTYCDINLQIGNNSGNFFKVNKGDGSGTLLQLGNDGHMLLWGNLDLETGFSASADQFSANSTSGGFQLPNFLVYQGGGTSSLFVRDRTNGYMMLTLGANHGTIAFDATSPVSMSKLTLVAAAPSVSAGQVGLGATTASTVGAAGAASALPANPLGYLIINVAGTAAKIPFYNN